MVSLQLQPIGPGTVVDPAGQCERRVDGIGYDAELTVVCEFGDAPVGVYSVVAGVGGSVYAGGAEDVIVVYDPSSRNTQGAGVGVFEWPGTADSTRFLFSMEYNKKGTNLKGSLMLVRTAPGGSQYVVKGNALYGLSLGTGSEPRWASFAGKATYRDPSMAEPEGNHEFLVYVEDGDRGGPDRFWFEVRDKTGTVIPESSFPRPGPDWAAVIDSGDVVVPAGDRTPGRSEKGSDPPARGLRPLL